MEGRSRCNAAGSSEWAVDFSQPFTILSERQPRNAAPHRRLDEPLLQEFRMSAINLCGDGLATARKRVQDADERHSSSHSFCRRIEDQQHCMMTAAFERSGGLASLNFVEKLMYRHSGKRLIDSSGHDPRRRILSYPWKAQTLVPLFQFDMADMSRRIEVDAVICELADIFDDWSLALWFAQPNCWLQDCAPVDVIRWDHDAVFNAARADRFVATI